MAGPVSPEGGREWRKGRGMNRDFKDQKYEDYITAVSREAAATGRREPYHLTYLRKYGGRGRIGRKAAEKNTGKGDGGV